MIRHTSLRSRLLAGVISSLVIVFALMTFLLSGVVRGALQEAVQKEVQNLVGEKVSQIDGFFSSVGRIPVVLGSASAMDEENDEPLLRARMREVVAQNPDIYGSTISFEPYAFYPDQKYFAPYYYRGGPGGAIAYLQFGSDDYVYWEWEWYTGPRDTGGLYWTQPFFDEGAGNIWMVTAAYPVVRDGDFIAVATVDVPIDSVKEKLQETRVGEGGFALMIDNRGGVIGTSGMEGLPEGSAVGDWVDQVGSPALRTLVADMLAGREGIRQLPDPRDQAGQMWAIYTTVPSTNWHMVTFVSVAELLAPVTRVSLLMAGIAFAALLILAGVVWFISNTITQPVDTLRSEALAIAAGDLSRRVPAEGRDEVSALGRAFNQMADELATLLASLEQRVAERTAKLEAAAEVSRTTTSLLDPGELLTEVVDLVRDRFDLYYVGLFLVDSAQEFAVLSAGTGEAGRQMLAQGHQLAVGGGSMIGQCVARSEARIALDVGAEAVRFDNPFLPGTRSEMALPLRSRGRVIGAMSVQSTQEAAFEETDISVMQTMADQVATALDNARLFAASQESLQATRRAYGQLSRDAWIELLSTRRDWGYCYNKGALAPLTGTWQPHMLQAFQAAQTVALPDGEGTALAVPVKIRDQVVGVLNFHKDGDTGKPWTPQEQRLLETLADQVGLALESARLYQDTQKRAFSERLVGEITAHMRQTLDIDQVLDTAVSEISAALGLAALDLHLGPEPPGDSRVPEPPEDTQP